MNEIDGKILSHVYIDYKYNPIYDTVPHPLLEEIGYVPEIDRYIDGFQEFIREKVFPFIKDGGTYSAQITTPSVFGVSNPFFKACNVDIIASIRDGKISWGSHYDQEQSFYNEYGGYVVIKLTAGASDGKQLLSILTSNFAHELTHAYDDYQATIKGGAPLSAATKKSGYQDRLLTWHLGDTANKRILGKMLYMLSPMELNAIIGQIKGELRGAKTSTPKEALNAIKNTLAYKQYTWLKTYVDALNNENNELIKNDFLVAYTRWAGNDKSKNMTYRGFLSELNSMFRKWERKFLTMVGKIAYKHYVDNEFPLINASDSDKEISDKNHTINEGFEQDREYYYDQRGNVLCK